MIRAQTTELDESLDVSKALNFAKQLQETKPESSAKNNVATSKPKRTYEAKAVDPHKSSKKKMTVTTSANRSDGTLANGTMVKDSKGVGIIVDNDYALKNIAENDEMLKKMRDLTDPNDPLFDNMQFKVNRPEGVETPIEEYIRKNPTSEEALKLAEVKKAFKGWDVCAMDPNTGAVLAPKGSPQCIAYKNAMEAVRSGKVRLPTVEEYEEQKRQALEQVKKGTLQPPAPPTQQVQPTQTQQNTQVQAPVEPEKKPEDTPVVEEKPLSIMEERIKMSEEAQKMNSTERQALINQAAEDPMIALANEPKLSGTPKPRIPEVMKPDNVAVNAAEDPMVAAAATTTPELKVEHVLEPAVINIGAAEVAGTIAEAETAVPEDDAVASQIVIEVPATKAETFMNTLTPDIKSKVDTAKKVKVNFVGEVSLPNTVRRLTSVRQYRSVAPKNIGSGVSAVVLINSGYVGYFSPVGSLEWALISPIQGEDNSVEYPDTGKIAQFAYSHLVSTSLGPMSYIEFCENTAYDDLPHIMYTLLKASQPDEQTVGLYCGRNTCEKEISVKYSIATLPDYTRMDEDARKQVVTVAGARDTIEEAQKVHEISPVMRKLVHVSKKTGSQFVFKNYDIATVVDRISILEKIQEDYGDTVAVLVQYTNEIYIKVDNTGDEEKDYAVTSDPEVIAKEYIRLDEDELKDLGDTLDAIPRFDQIRYSIKERVVCPHCGNVMINPRQDVMELVFRKALLARYSG